MVFLTLQRFCNTVVRVRFAPSPTGDLHLGGLRTALYNHFFVRQRAGKFVLRIEDTDQTRFVDGAVDKLCNDLQWAGIQIDEGPYFQSKRLHLYKEHVEMLLQNGNAYYCFCAERRLDLLRRNCIRNQQTIRYDNRCRELTPDQIQEKFSTGSVPCIRFKLSEGLLTFNDLIGGEITKDVTLSEGDPIIVKSDGFPTYHFANIIDDHLMEITHVLRGIEWQISTPKHLMLYKAFNWQPPQYAHLPLLLNKNGRKFSKRQGDCTIKYFRETGILPVTLMNLVVSSGAGFDTIKYHKNFKCYEMDELIQNFNVKKILNQSSRLRVDLLDHLNFDQLMKELQSTNRSRVIEQLKLMLSNKFECECDLQTEHIENVLNWACNRIKKLNELLLPNFQYLWTIPTYDKSKIEFVPQLQLLYKEWSGLQLDSKPTINQHLKQFCKDNHVKYSDFMHTLRLLISGLEVGPSVAEMVQVLGKECILKRLDSAIQTSV